MQKQHSLSIKMHQHLLNCNVTDHNRKFVNLNKIILKGKGKHKERKTKLIHFMIIE